MSDTSIPSLKRLRRVVGEAKDLALGEAAVEAGLITPDQFSECEGRAAESPGLPFRRVLKEHGGISAEVFDLLERLTRTKGGRRTLADRYEIRGEIGRGGSGVIYRAWDRQLERMVALKVLRAEFRKNPDMIARLRQEAFAVARLHHPHLMGLHDVGEIGGLPFLVLELLEGSSLQDCIEKKSLAPRRCVEILEKVARAVHHAHLQGIVHRDLKPGNIKIDRDGEPHVLDFGLAHLYGSDHRLTMTGHVLGTPIYMSPEQVQGDRRHLDARTDVYGLGATLYELLAGRPPFFGCSLNDIYNRILLEEPALPRRYNPAIHPDLEKILLKALEKEPRRRYESALAFADDLRRHLEGDPIRGRPTTVLRRFAKRIARHKAKLAAFGSAILILFGIATWTFHRTVQRRAALRQLRMEIDSCWDRGDWHRVAALCSDAESAGDRDPQWPQRRRTAEMMALASEGMERLEGLPQADEEPVEECLRQIEFAARRALTLMPDLAAAKRMLGDLYFLRYSIAQRNRSPSASRFLTNAIAFGGDRIRERVECTRQ